MQFFCYNYQATHWLLPFLYSYILYWKWMSLFPNRQTYVLLGLEESDVTWLLYEPLLTIFVLDFTDSTKVTFKNMQIFFL